MGYLTLCEVSEKTFYTLHALTSGNDAPNVAVLLPATDAQGLPSATQPAAVVLGSYTRVLESSVMAPGEVVL